MGDNTPSYRRTPRCSAGRCDGAAARAGTGGARSARRGARAGEAGRAEAAGGREYAGAGDVISNERRFIRRGVEVQGSRTTHTTNKGAQCASREL